MSLTLSMVEKASTGEIFKYANDLNITGSTMWELRQKLLVRVMKDNGSVIDLTGYTQSAMEAKEATILEDEKRRKKLEVYLEEVKEIYTTIMSFEKIKEHVRGDLLIIEKDDPLISFIKNEMKTVTEDFEKMTETVKRKPNCTLLICGDSGAGKSSFINLLIGENVLPTSIRSNTSCQVRLTYGEHERAEIIDLKSKKFTIEKSEFSSSLSDYLANIEDRGEVSCKSAVIYLKSVILEGGLDIYDTIGLGETEMFNNELKKELNEITGIIFLLKKNNPIGDTTIGGLSEIIHQLAVKGLPWGSMNFIINMCDLLQNSAEKEGLKQNVIDQLRDKCTLFNPEVRTFSTKQELDFQKNNVMTDNYKQIIQLIHRMHISSINTNTVKVFSFILKFVQQTIDQINELEKYSASNKAERRDYILRLRNLEHDRKQINQGFTNDNCKYLIEEKKSCQKRVEEYFHKTDSRDAIVQEVVNRQSELYGMTKIDEINRKIEEITHEEISKSFKHFIITNNILKMCCDKMLTTFIQQFAEHQKKKENIHKAMNRHIDSVMGVIECDFKDIIAAQAHNKGFLDLISPILVPIIRIKEIIVKASWYSYISSVFNKVNIHTFYDDTSTYVQRQATSKYYNYCRRSSNIVKLIECLFQAPEKVTKDFEKYLADDMDYLAKNIKLLDDDMRKTEIVFGTYREIKTKLLVIHEDICEFSLLRLHKEKEHIMHDKIKFLPSSVDLERIKPVVKGRNRLVFQGQIECELSHDSSIIVFKNKDNKTWRDSYEEFRKHNEINAMKLRKDFTELSQCFLDLQRHVIFYIDYQGNLNPTFIVNGIESSLTTYINERRRHLQEEKDYYEEKLYKEICELLKQILLGLKYLHSKSLVHYDLTGDSIGYSAYGLKLTSVSLPTNVKVKYEKNSQKYVLKMAHLPISILDPDKPNLYDARSDMYCLGILLYTMWSGLHPFFTVVQTNNIINITDFVNIINKYGADSVILKEVFLQAFALVIDVWSCQCRDGKMTAEQFLKDLEIPKFIGYKKD